MAMPLETGKPCKVKLMDFLQEPSRAVQDARSRAMSIETYRVGRRNASEHATRQIERAVGYWKKSLAFSKIVRDQSGNGSHCFLFFLACRFDVDGRAFRRRQHHHAHDALGIHASS